MTLRIHACHLRLLLVVLLALPLGATIATAAEQNTSALSDNGWFSDDTRADGTGTQSVGTNLISTTLTDDPEGTASGLLAHDADILQQINFLLAPGTVPLGTHPNAVNLNIGPTSSGKSQISHRKDDVLGHGSGSGFGPGFTAEYSWMGNGTASVTMSLKFGIKTADFGSTGISSRTGENVWDKILIYEPGNLNGGTSDATWQTETISHTAGKWWFFDRTVGASTIGLPVTFQNMSTNATTFSGAKTLQDVYNLITAPGAIITSVQLGIGSGNANGNVYVNQMETSVYRAGDITTFGLAPVHNLTQVTDHFTIQDAIDNAVPGDVIAADAGTYNENVVLDKSLTLNGAQAGVDARGRVVGPPNATVESILTAASGTLLRLVSGSAGSVIDGFSFDGASTAAKGLDSSSGPIDGVRILNNYMVGMTNTPMFLNDTGEDIDITQNEFDGSTTTVVHIDTDNFDGLHFVDNIVRNGGTGLFVDGNRNIGPSVARAPMITGNLFDGNVTGANLGKRAFELGTISDNTFSNNSVGDGLQGGIKDALITNNTFSDNFRFGLSLTSFGDANPAKGAQGNTISDNTFTGNGRAGLFFSSGQAPGTISTNVANNNDFVGNLPVGAEYGGTEVIDVGCNWWGDIDGPDAPLTSPNPAGDSLNATTLVFAPWLDGSIAGSPTCNQYGPNNVAPLPSGACLSITNTCESVPMMFNRLDTSGARGISVTFQLSNNLALCDSVVPANSLPQGTWLAGTTTYLIVDNGNGSYTVDQSNLGLPCGVTTGGLLFNVQVQKRLGAVDGTGTITVTDVLVRDCANATLAGIPGPPASITIDSDAPTTIADLAAAQVKSGNDADGTTKIALTWSPVEVGATVEVWRKGFGDYPEYDDGTGSVPTAPASPAAAGLAGWALTAVTASGTTDEVATRDFYYFVAFVTDACGNVSTVSNRTDGTLNYHLGDVTDSITPGDGNNLVSTADISALGADYGKVLIFNDPVNWLDVGPTTDFSVDALPTTDNVVQFEDLMMFAINFGQVSKQGDGLVLAAFNELALEAPSVVEAGQIIGVTVWMAGAGDVQGLSVALSWNERVLTPIGVETGQLLAVQGGIVLSAEPGVIDVALLGTRDRALSGEGTLAKAMFRVIGDGDPQLEIAGVDARDDANQRVEVGMGSRRDNALQTTPRVTALLQNVPNPFNPTTRIAFTLAKPGQVELAIYDVSGRRIKTLLQMHRDAGQYEETWNGTDMSGARVASGIYYMRLTTSDGRYSRPMSLLK